MMKKYFLTIGWLYPRLMNTYGDRGNVIVLQKRLEWRGIESKIQYIHPGEKIENVKRCDLLFMGGAQDTQQEIVEDDLRGKAGSEICRMIEDDIPALLVCGGYQFLGKYYVTADGHRIEGLGLLPLVTKNPGKNISRLVGNIVIKPQLPEFPHGAFVVGFENHGGRTYLTDEDAAFATVVRGHGNNGEDGTEGIYYKSTIGTYLHGPILSKSPELCDWILSRALVKKYGEPVVLHPLDDTFAYQARNRLVKSWYWR